MPWGDGTGPWWLGSKDQSARWANPWCKGRCMGRGTFMRRSAAASGFYPLWQPTQEEERGYLENIARTLEEDLRSIKEKIDRLRLDKDQ